ncbi:MAG TPA: hypothetical protein VMD98_14165, partial [Bryocella sp.]|nr:hypothetical protein [Bryocella sp.]
EEVLVVTRITEKMPDTKDLGPLRASDILAERLPSVPNKTEVDAAGNAKPAGATPAQPAAPGTAAPSTGATARPPTFGAAVNKPANGASATGANNKPAAGVAGKPVGAATTPRATTTGTANGATPATPPIKVRVVDNDDASPAPKKTKPAPESTPTTPPESAPSESAPSTSPAGVQPQP